MLESLNLTTIILAELLFIVTLACGLLALGLRQARKRYRDLLLAYEKQRQKDKRPAAAADTGQDQHSAQTDPVAAYFKQQEHLAQERYHSITGARLPKLSSSQELGANLAALRYLYCRTETQAYRNQKQLGNLWVTLEKELQELLHWVSDRQEQDLVKQKTRELKILQNQARMLRDRLAKLEPLRTDKARLERRLTLNKVKQEELERRHSESQKTIDKLRRINRHLTLKAGQEEHSPAALRQAFAQDWADEANADYQQQITKITQFSRENQRLGSDLTRGVKQYADNYPTPREQQLKETIKKLEAELYHSHRHLKALKDADSGLAVNKIEDTLKGLQSGLAQSATSLYQGQEKSSGTGHSLAEIQQMHHNNQRQRQLIVELEREMQELRENLPEIEDASERDQQTRELERLESLLQESQHCIVALESQVDMLFNQLHEREAMAASGPGDAAARTQDQLVQMEHELEVMSDRLQDTLLKSWESRLVKQFALESLQAETPEQLARLLAKLLRVAELTSGFVLQSSGLGQVGYFPSKHFTSRERRMVQHTQQSAEVGYLNEGILFASRRLKLLLKNPPEENQELTHTEELLKALCRLASDRVIMLELHQLSQQQGQTMEDWVQEAHRGLLNLDIAYAYEAEETMRLVKACTHQVREASQSQSLSKGTKLVIDNALQECEVQIKQLFNRPDSVDRNCEALMKHLDALPGGASKP